eukprot:357202-Chlamydomonas_euryale.AAC.2
MSSVAAAAAARGCQCANLAAARPDRTKQLQETAPRPGRHRNQNRCRAGTGIQPGATLCWQPQSHAVTGVVAEKDLSSRCYHAWASQLTAPSRALRIQGGTAATVQGRYSLSSNALLAVAHRHPTDQQKHSLMTAD